MILTLARQEHLQHCTIGRMKIDQADLGIWTLEPPVRDVKVLGSTAIPAGTYKIELRFSPHFQMVVPHILNVPDFEYVEIHPGNDSANTEACILVGLDHNVGMDFIGRSRIAFELVFNKIQAAIAAGDTVEIDIT